MGAQRSTLRVVDRLVLFVAWIATCGVVWVLGFYVGRGAGESRPTYDERPVRLPVTSEPPAVGAHQDAPSGLSFYEQLTTASPPPGTAGMDAPKAEAVPPPVPPTPQGQAATPPSTIVAATRTEPTVPRVTTSTTVPPKATEPATKPPPGRGWTVQAAPTRDRGEAESLQANLKRRGYDVSVVRVQRDGETWYRLRVGRYGSSEEASEVMRRLRQKEGVPQAFVATD